MFSGSLESYNKYYKIPSGIFACVKTPSKLQVELDSSYLCVINWDAASDPQK